MKATGIVRKIDTLGRIVLPVEIRKTLGIEIKDAVEVFVDSDSIILQKYAPACIFCDNAKDLNIYKNGKICRECIERVKLELKYYRKEH